MCTPPPPPPLHLPRAIDIFPFSSFIFLAATAHLAAVCLIYAICHVLYLFLSTFYEVNNLNFCSARLWSGDRSAFTLPACLLGWPARSDLHVNRVHIQCVGGFNCPTRTPRSGTPPLLCALNIRAQIVVE